MSLGIGNGKPEGGAGDQGARPPTASAWDALLAAAVAERLRHMARDEGFVPRAYECTGKETTIGLGFVIRFLPLWARRMFGWPAPADGRAYDETEIAQLPQVSLEVCLRVAERMLTELGGRLRAAAPWVERLDAARLGALLDMGYNLGLAGLLGFPSMLGALRAFAESDDPAERARLGEAARAHALDSKWHGDVKARARRTASIFADGVEDPGA